LPFVEDHSEYDNPDGFGSVVTLLSGTQDEREINGLFDAAHVLVDVNSEVGVSSVGPVLNCPTAETADLEQDDALRIDGVDYKIVDIQPDGTGRTDLILHKAT